MKLGSTRPCNHPVLISEGKVSRKQLEPLMGLEPITSQTRLKPTPPLGCKLTFNMNFKSQTSTYMAE